jgi:hypothetical protein
VRNDVEQPTDFGLKTSGFCHFPVPVRWLLYPLICCGRMGGATLDTARFPSLQLDHRPAILRFPYPVRRRNQQAGLADTHGGDLAAVDAVRGQLVLH